MAIRKHNYSGIPWFEHKKRDLEIQIRNCFEHRIGPQKLPPDSITADLDILGIVSPHAGFSCSGPHAAHGFLELSKVKQVDTVVVLGTNHTGMGPPISVFPKGSWETPLGSVTIDGNLQDEFMAIAKEIDFKDKLSIGLDTEAHITEHSIDNQIPFLQFIYHNQFQLLPICLGIQSFERCQLLGKILAKMVEETQKKVLFVASSDFTHYLTNEEAAERDRQVINLLLKGEINEARKKQQMLHASICGIGPILTLFSLAKILSSKFSAKELIYGHSGQTCSSNNQVVAYASILVVLT